MATVCKRVLYSGYVQGVGFRYSTRSIARGFSVAGFVRNLPNGRVELVAEGEAVEVSAFVTAVKGRWAGSITDMTEIDDSPAGLSGFTIRS
jgi:acylphosphatase